MLRSLISLQGYTLRARDGEIGRVEQFFFDDERWVVRYLVVHTRGVLIKKRVLIPPSAVIQADWISHSLQVALDMNQIKTSPDIDTEMPISRQKEMEYLDYYHWPHYWLATGAWGIGYHPAGPITGPRHIPSPQDQGAQTRLRNVPRDASGDTHLRSFKEVLSYSVEAKDARFGRVEDLIVDDDGWVIRYLAIDTVRWLPSKSVLIPPDWVESISWTTGAIRINLSEAEIKASPEFRPGDPINREYEVRLYDYYGRPAYWEKEKPESFTKASKHPGRYVL